MQMPAQNEARVLVVDDEPEICRIIQRYLSREGYLITTAGNGQEMRRALAADSIDLIILDVRLPGEDGLTLLRWLRRTTHIPVIMLTVKRDLVDKVLGLESGADDYLPKPFHPRELLARVRAILRRTASVEPVEEDNVNPIIGFCGWRLDPGARTLHSPAGEPVSLTGAELDLLLVLAQNPNRILSRDFLLGRTRNRPALPFERTIDVHIGRLRRKIELNPAHPSVIKTVRNAGYVFTAGVTRHPA